MATKTTTSNTPNHQKKKLKLHPFFFERYTYKGCYKEKDEEDGLKKSTTMEQDDTKDVGTTTTTVTAAAAAAAANRVMDQMDQ